MTSLPRKETAKSANHSESERSSRLPSELEDRLGPSLAEFRANNIRRLVVAAVIFTIIYAIVGQFLPLNWLGLLLIYFGMMGVFAAVLELTGWAEDLASYHELGLGFRCSGAWHAVPFEELESFTAIYTKRFSHGIYLGMSIVFRFGFTTHEGSPHSFCFDSSMTSLDDEKWDQLHNRATEAVAKRLQAQLHKGEEIVWTPRIRITNDGLHTSHIVWSEERNDAFHEITFRMADGRMHLSAHDKPLATVSLDVKNSYPIWRLIERHGAQPS